MHVKEVTIDAVCMVYVNLCLSCPSCLCRCLSAEGAPAEEFEGSDMMMVYWISQLNMVTGLTACAPTGATVDGL